MKAAFNCQRCGWCCESVTINVGFKDIVSWAEQGRRDILSHISWIEHYPHKDTGGFYIAQTAKAPKQPCPFFEKTNGSGFCKIQSTKPVACKDAPRGYETFDGCSSFVQMPKKARNKVIRRQYKDFKQAHKYRKELLQILYAAR